MSEQNLAGGYRSLRRTPIKGVGITLKWKQEQTSE